MARQRGAGDYRGDLRRPIMLPFPRGVFATSPHREAREAATIERAEAKQLPALFAHFGIREDDPERWRQLALALAHKHVRGFQVVRSTGAPVKESVELLCRFYRYFIRTKADRRRSIRTWSISTRKVTHAEVCEALLKDEDFKRAFPELKSVSSKRLQNLVSKARRLRKARITDILRRVAVKRRVGPDEFENLLIMFGDLSPWISDKPSAWFLKYSKGSPPRRRA